MIRNSFFTLLTVLAVLGCSAPKTNVVRPQTGSKSGMYNPASTKLHPSYSVYHNSDNSSVLLVKVFPVELLYSDANADRNMVAKLRVTFQLTDITDPSSAVLADSGTYDYVFRKENSEKRFITQISLKALKDKIYELRINAVDKTRNEENITFKMIDKTSRFSQHNYLVTDLVQNLPYFEPVLTGEAPFRIEYRTDTFSRVFISYFGQETPLPRPSFSLAREREFMEKPDSLWILKYQKSVPYKLGYEGIFHFQFDTTVREGLTILNFGPDYPRIKQPRQMVEPLAYLTSSVEYDEIKKEANPKLAVDNFWLGLTNNNMDRARELIRVYYNRVYFANYYFTTFKPGWKTDRGMIYVIYGPPQAVARTPGSEKWIYYKNSFANTLTFTFDYRSSPYTQNNFILQRSEGYDGYWRQAIDTWRKGSVFMIE
jgi:GWxTD domain-containing protein